MSLQCGSSGSTDAKVALITGAASGIGWATAKRFASAGFRVAVADLDGMRADQRAKTLGTGHSWCEIDIAGPDAPRLMIDHCIRTFGRLDVLVNNAGRTTNSGLALIEQPADVFAGILAVNFEGSMAAARSAAAAMTSRGGGSIVNVASGAAFRAIPFRSSYSASKAAVVAASVRLAAELSDKRVRVNVVAPGFVRTELLDDLIQQGRLDPSHAISKIPMGRMGTAEELADAIFFMAVGGRFTGATLSVDGGSQAFGGSGAVPARLGEPALVIDADPRVYLVAGEAQDLAPLLAKQHGCDVAVEDHSLGTVYRNGRYTVVAVARADGLREESVHAIRDRFGPIAGVLNGVGLQSESTADQFVVFHNFIKQVGPTLLAQGSGSFVTVVPVADDAVSAGRDAAIEMLMRTLACEWGPQGVRANSIRIASGNIDATSMRELAVAAHYLVSAASGFVNGAQLDIRLRIASNGC